MRWILFSLLFAVCPWTSPSADATNDSRGHGNLEGVVFDQRGHPVADATVVIVRRGDGRPFELELQTDDRGRFRARHLRAGKYLVTAHKRDVGRDRARIRIRAGHTTTVRLRLH